MLIVIEGLDNTGKSTLAQELHGAACAEVRHWGKPTHRNPYDEYIGPLQHYKPGGPNLVCDRHYLGECVWPYVFDRPPLMQAHHRRYIEAYLHDVGALLVLAERDIGGVEQANEDEEGAPQYDVALASDLFRRAWAESSVHGLIYRHEEMELGVNAILDTAQVLEEVALSR